MELDYIAIIKNHEIDDVYATLTQKGEGPYKTHIEAGDSIQDLELDQALSHVKYSLGFGTTMNFGVDISNLSENHAYAKMTHTIELNAYDPNNGSAEGPIYGYIDLTTEHSGEGYKTIDMKPLLDIMGPAFGGMLEMVTERTDKMVFTGDFSDEVMTLYNTALKENDAVSCALFAEELNNALPVVHVSHIEVAWHENKSVSGLHFEPESN